MAWKLSYDTYIVIIEPYDEIWSAVLSGFQQSTELSSFKTASAPSSGVYCHLSRLGLCLSSEATNHETGEIEPTCEGWLDEGGDLDGLKTY